MLIQSYRKANGYGSFAVVRVYQSSGHVDPNGAQSIINARNAGIPYVDGYIFPCYSCGGGYSQAVTAVEHLKSAGARFGMIWLDIEGPGTYWSSSQSANRAFFEDLVSGLKSQGVSIGQFFLFGSSPLSHFHLSGVYTSASQWNPIMGSYTGGSSFPLWCVLFVFVSRLILFDCQQVCSLRRKPIFLGLRRLRRLD